MFRVQTVWADFLHVRSQTHLLHQFPQPAWFARVCGSHSHSTLRPFLELLSIERNSYVAAVVFVDRLQILLISQHNQTGNRGGDDVENLLISLFNEAVAAVHPRAVLPGFLVGAGLSEPVTVVGAGKAVAAMAEVAEQMQDVRSGIVVTTRGLAAGCACRKIKVLEASHLKTDWRRHL